MDYLLLCKSSVRTMPNEKSLKSNVAIPWKKILENTVRYSHNANQEYTEKEKSYTGLL